MQELEIPKRNLMLQKYQQHELANRKLRSVNEYVKDLQLFFRYLDERKQHFLALREEDLEEYRLSLTQSPARKNRILASIKNFYKYLKRIKEYDRNISEDLESFTEHPKVRKPPALKVIEQFIRTAREPYATMFLFQVSTGARIGETLGLKISDIDHDNRSVVLRGKARGTESKERYLSNLPNKLLSSLQNYLRNKRPESELEEFFLFDEKRNLPVRPVTEASYGYYLRKHLGHSSHAARRFFVTDLAEQGVDPSRIAILTGHASVKTIYEAYLHVTEKMTSEIMEHTSIRAEELEEEKKQEIVNKKDKLVGEIDRLLEEVTVLRGHLREVD